MTNPGGHRMAWAALLLTTAAWVGQTPDATTGYLDRLLRGDSAGLLAGFVGAPAIDDPVGGRVRGRAALGRFVADRHAWLAARSARLEMLRTTTDVRHTVVEALLHLNLPDTSIDLPIAVVGDRSDGNRVTAIRVYHSHWPLEGRHEIRHPLLSRDSGLVLRDVVAEYQRALAAGDAVAALSTFEPDGYFREPSGGIYVHRGREALRQFLTAILAGGGIHLEHCSVTDDGVVAAIEFNAVQFGANRLEPQAGLAIYERGATGRLAAARIYDDVNVEALVVSDPYHAVPRDTVPPALYDGWKQYVLLCERCHGEDARGTSFAPSLVAALRADGSIATEDRFMELLRNGRIDKGMPSAAALGLDSAFQAGLYQYLKGRSDGVLHGGRPARKE